jgi:hypothetical protein
MERRELQSINLSKREIFVGCYIDKWHTLYPDSAVEIPLNVQKKIFESCKELIK